MTQNETRPFGSWPSPYTPERIARGGRKLAQPHCHEGRIYWLEGRPEEGGRNVLRCWHDGRIETLTPDGYSLKSKAQEYGGGVWCAVDADTRFFIEESDQGLYRQAGEDVDPVCRVDGLRFADLQWDTAHKRIVAVCEDHREGGMEPTNSLVAIDPGSGDIATLAAGSDFYIGPRPGPDGRYLAWVEWDHPNMPWDRTRLCVATLDETGVPAETEVLTDDPPEAVFQPEWGTDGRLWFISDRESGWWNLYRRDGTGIEAISDDAAEFGMPWWGFNMRSWGLLGKDSALAARSSDGFWSLTRIDGDRLRTLDTSWSTIRHLHTDGEQAVMLAGRPDHPLAIVRIDPEAGPAEVLATASQPPDADWPLSEPEAIDFPTGDGETAHALYYPPAHPACQGPGDERPPLLVQCHGGPTGATDSAFDPRIQFWTSRGFAVADVNYRGSTGYGRAYRRRLYSEWGRADVEDCAAVIDALAVRDAIDPARCVISGSSAGGYTVLAALTFTDRFAAGASHYGIGDLAALDATTHKFESRYLDQLVGPLPDARATWEARSPIHHVDRLNAPVIFFQGDEDRIVPPDQAEAMVDALRQKGLPVAHVLFEGEGHGFRRAENIESALARELAFYGRMLGFQPSDPDPGLVVENT